MTVKPTYHAADHAAGGDDPITGLDSLTLADGAVTLTAVATAPATPASGAVVLYAVEDGAGHSLSVKFDDGTVVELADNVA